jgi:hypothetical protein
LQLTQIEFKNRAPAGCLQYFTDTSGIYYAAFLFTRSYIFHHYIGVVQTMNFGDNGRHLADQDYNICIKQGESKFLIKKG